MKRPFLCCYEYGMGGVWVFIRAGTRDEITTKFPQLTVVEERPEWMTPENEPGDDMTFDVDSPTGWLKLFGE